MKWARRITGAVAIGVLALWITSALFASFSYRRTVHVGIGRAGLAIEWLHNGQTYPSSSAFVSGRPGGPYWKWPHLHQRKSLTNILIPHWLINLIAWILYLIFRRMTRPPPPGHCQSCGYNLNGAQSGRCPECNSTIETKT